MKNNIKLFALCAVFISAAAFAERAPEYISPNNDGKKDALEIPLKIKEKRYVKEWALTITNENGEVVRTIGNKVALPEKISFKSFFKSLATPKQGVDIPSSVVWNGFLSDGTVAPDGIYYYQFTAKDDNDNEASTSKFQVVVDNTPPAITLAKMSDNEKSFGEGSKAVLKIKQSGSKENLWTAKITDNNGKAIKTYKWEDSTGKAEPVEVSWDGTDDNGMIVADGIYNYEITSKDLADNVSEKAQIQNIIFSAEKPEIMIAINGSKYFAPEGKSETSIKNIKFDVSIPSPKASVNTLVQWNLAVVGKNDDKALKSIGGTDNPESVFIFDGKTDDGKNLPKGEYRTKITARYKNGYEPVPVYSPVFVIDNEVPNAKIEAPANKVFNGTKNLEIAQSSTGEEEWTGEKNWTGRILDENDKIVRQFDFGSNLPSIVEWNALDNSGKIVADGKYHYELSVSELAGNKKVYPESQKIEFTLDTSKTELALNVVPESFNPKRDSVNFITRVNASSGLASYEIDIMDSNKVSVKKISGTGNLPSSISWNGMSDSNIRCTDGKYSVSIVTVAQSGTKSSPVVKTFEIDTVDPSVELVADYSSFSPENTSTKQTLPVKIVSSSLEELWTAQVKNAKNAVVKTLSWNNSKVIPFAWDGTDESGNVCANGTYSIEVFAKDKAGNTGNAKLSNIVLDTRIPSAFITADYTGISPNGDGNLEKQKFNLKVSLTEGIESWTFDLIDGLNGSVVKTFSDKDQKNLPSLIEWAGEKSDNTIADGTYLGKLNLVYAKGNTCEAVSAPFICTAIPPVLSVKTNTNYFSPDNDGNDDELKIKLGCKTRAELKSWEFVINDRNGNQFWKTSGKSAITERIIWDGRGNNGDLVESAEDYPYVFVVRDNLGMSSKVEGKIGVDVLVVRDGDKLKMQVPSIIFRSDEADFGVQVTDAKGKVVKEGITETQKKNNERVINRIAEILNKFGDYKVTIVGHANPMTDNPDEETVDNPNLWGPALTPLSKRRAEYVKNMLVEKKVSASRLSVDGKGGTEIVADSKDKKVNWKNRRVEFILEKK